VVWRVNGQIETFLKGRGLWALGRATLVTSHSGGSNLVLQLTLSRSPSSCACPWSVPGCLRVTHPRRRRLWWTRGTRRAGMGAVAGHGGPHLSNRRRTYSTRRETIEPATASSRVGACGLVDDALAHRSCSKRARCNLPNRGFTSVARTHALAHP
jgi:hypothetical protein